MGQCSWGSVAAPDTAGSNGLCPRCLGQPKSVQRKWFDRLRGGSFLASVLSAAVPWETEELLAQM